MNKNLWLVVGLAVVVAAAVLLGLLTQTSENGNVNIAATPNTNVPVNSASETISPPFRITVPDGWERAEHVYDQYFVSGTNAASVSYAPLSAVHEEIEGVPPVPDMYIEFLWYPYDPTKPLEEIVPNVYGPNITTPAATPVLFAGWPALSMEVTPADYLVDTEPAYLSQAQILRLNENELLEVKTVYMTEATYGTYHEAAQTILDSVVIDPDLYRF